MRNELQSGFIKSAKDVVDIDLDYICRHLEQEFGVMAGKRLLITGGAGFLGHYLVQSVLHWNRIRPGRAIALTIYDSFIRGVPEWLKRCSTESTLNVVKHDIRDPLPDNVGTYQYLIHAASIASPTYYRRFPIETMDANVNGLRSLLDYSLHQKEKGEPVEGFLFFSTAKFTATRLRRTSRRQRPTVVMSPALARVPVMTNRSAMARRYASISPCTISCRSASLGLSITTAPA